MLDRRSFLKLAGLTAAAVATSSDWLRVHLVSPCPLCEAGFAHWPESKSFDCGWRQLNKSLREKGLGIPEAWLGGQNA